MKKESVSSNEISTDGFHEEVMELAQKLANKIIADEYAAATSALATSLRSKAKKPKKRKTRKPEFVILATIPRKHTVWSK